MPDRAGTQLGNYRLLRLLGQGGTAEVYLGEHVYLKWLAALKVLRTKLFDEEAEQFVREAQMLSHLSHPNIVRVLDFAVQDAQPFLVTEYAPHGTLRTRHPRGTSVSVTDVAVYVQQVASALQYAHEQRVVHRDIKPENMLLGSQQEVLLADFGIALLTSSCSREAVRGTETGGAKTRQEYAQGKERSVAGTTLYMAPEQLQGEPQAASDQYALAVVVYEWLSGRRPFEGTLLEVSMQHLTTPPTPLRHWQPDLLSALEQVVLRALAKDPRDRFPSVRDFADAFLDAAHSAGGAGFATVPLPVPVAANGQFAAQTQDTLQIVTTGEGGESRENWPRHQAMMPDQTHVTSGYAADEKPQVPSDNEPLTDEKAQILAGSEPVANSLWKVPAALASLIGREREIQDICDLLMQPEVRLVTLLGPGGIGKTRLSIALATQLRDSFAGGICFVALTMVSDAEQMMTAIAHELGLQEQERSYQEAVLEFLRDKQCLLLLDNFEQLVQASQAVPLLESLLATCPQVKILVSSRAVLHLPVEHQYRLSSLAVPDVTSLPETKSEAIVQYAAVALFVQRARTLVPTFQVTAVNAPALAEICARLDGIPLAIELAAARIKLLPPQALLPRLSNSLQVLTKGLPTLPERQQTLRGTIQWSYDLLDSGEQQVFRLLSVFAGGFTLSAVEDLYSSLYTGSEGAPGSVLDVVESLIDSSLVLPPGQEDEADEPHLSMLETVREYSRERLIERGEREAARQAHAELFLHIAEGAESELTGVQQALWLERLEREHDNLRAAMEWMLENETQLPPTHVGTQSTTPATASTNVGAQFRAPATAPTTPVTAPTSVGAQFRAPDGAVSGGRQAQDSISRREMALRLGSALSTFWLAHGYPHEGRAFMDRALSGGKPGEPVSLSVQAQAFRVTSDVHMRLGDLEHGEALLAQSLQCFRMLGDRANVASCLRGLGWIAHQKSEAERAYALYEEALVLYKELDNRKGIANTLLNIAFLKQTQGDYERARVLLEEVVARQRALDNKVGLFGALYQLGQVLFGLYGVSDAPRIRALLEEGLDLARELDNRRGVASMQGMLGWVAYSEGNLDEAAQLVEDCLLFFKDGGDRLVTGHYLSLLGQITTAQRDYAGAQALFKEGLAIAREIGDNKNEIVPNCLEGLAELALLQGYHPWAARLWGAAGHWREMIDVGMMPSQRLIQERLMETARDFLGTQAFDALLTEGRTLSPEEAFVARSALLQSQRYPQKAQVEQTEQTARQKQAKQTPAPLPNSKKKKIPTYPAGLSAREVDILRLVAEGLSDTEVAERLIISPRTVTTHLTSIYNKLGVNSRVSATRFAVEHHLV